MRDGVRVDGRGTRIGAGDAFRCGGRVGGGGAGEVLRCVGELRGGDALRGGNSDERVYSSILC